MYKVKFHKKTKKDLKKLKAAQLANNAKSLIDIIKKNPHQNPPPYEKLTGNLSGLYSRRINIRHRLVYEVIDEDKLIKV